MNPDFPNTPPQPPIQPGMQAPEAYLDAISEHLPVKKRFLSGKMLVVIISAVVTLIAVVIISIVVNNSRLVASSKVSALGARLDDLQIVLQYNKSNPVDNSITTNVSAEITLIMESRRNDLSKVYAIANSSTAKVNYAKSPIKADLDAANARGNLDDAYAAALHDKLLAVCKQIKVLYDSGGANAAQKAALDKAYNDFQELAARIPTPAT
jgi:hypothetical protein